MVVGLFLLMNHALAVKGVYLQVKHIISTHISLAKANHMVKPGIKGMGKYNPSSGRGTRYCEQL